MVCLVGCTNWLQLLPISQWIRIKFQPLMAGVANDMGLCLGLKWLPLREPHLSFVLARATYLGGTLLFIILYTTKRRTVYVRNQNFTGLFVNTTFIRKWKRYLYCQHHQKYYNDLYLALFVLDKIICTYICM